MIYLMLYYFSHLSPSVKDKAEILLQVEELLHIKEELSSQVSYSEVKMTTKGRGTFFT